MLLCIAPVVRLTSPENVGGPQQTGVAHLLGESKGIFLWRLRRAQEEA